MLPCTQPKMWFIWNSVSECARLVAREWRNMWGLHLFRTPALRNRHRRLLRSTVPLRDGRSLEHASWADALLRNERADHRDTVPVPIDCSRLQRCHALPPSPVRVAANARAHGRPLGIRLRHPSAALCGFLATARLAQRFPTGSMNGPPPLPTALQLPPNESIPLPYTPFRYAL